MVLIGQKEAARSIVQVLVILVLPRGVLLGVHGQEYVA